MLELFPYFSTASSIHFYHSITDIQQVFNREKFSRGSRSYLVVTVKSICYKWLQKFQLQQKVTYFRSYLVLTIVTSICYKWLQKFQLQQKFTYSRSYLVGESICYKWHQKLQLQQKVTNGFKSSNCNKNLPILGITLL